MGALRSRKWPTWPVYAAIKFCIGLNVSVFGPLAGRLAAQTHSDPAALGSIFGVGTIFEITGCILMGFIFDRVRNQHHLVMVSCVLLSISMALVPLAESVTVLTLFWGLSILPRPFLASGTNILIVWEVGVNCSATLNFATGMFGLGGMLSPLLVRLVMGLGAGDSLNPTFWTIAVVSLLVSLSLFFFECPQNPALVEGAHSSMQQKETELHTVAAADGSHKIDTPQKTYTTRREWSLLALGTAAISLSVALEVTFAAWVATIGNQTLDMGINETILINSAYWATFTATRLFIAPAVFRFTGLKSAQALVGAGCVTLVGLAVALIWRTQISLWICTFMFGCGIGPFVPTGIAQLQKWSPMSGVKQSVLSISIAIFGGVSGAVATEIISNFGYVPGLFVYYISLSSVLLALAITILVVDNRISHHRDTHEHEERKGMLDEGE